MIDLNDLFRLFTASGFTHNPETNQFEGGVAQMQTMKNNMEDDEEFKRFGNWNDHD